MSSHQHDDARYNLYAGIHKAVRALLAEALVTLGQTDWQDPVDRLAATSELRELLGFLRAHLRHENEFIHPAMEARTSGSAARIAHEHVEHGQAIDALDAMIREVERQTGPDRTRAGEALYRQFAVFAGENLLHMHIEETAHNAVLWAAYADSEIEQIERNLVAALPPDEAMQSLGGILRYSSPAERATLLIDVCAHAPAPVFEGMLTMLRPQLSERDRAKLDAALAMPLHQAA